MGWLSKFFNLFKPKTASSLTTYTFGRGYSGRYYFDAWEQDIFRAIVDCIATHAAKGKIRHVRLDSDGQVKTVIHNSEYAKLLNIKPNPIMSAYEFKYWFFSQLETKGLAVAYIKWITDGSRVVPDTIFPVSYSSLDIRELVGGGYAIEFDDYEGVHRFLPLEDCIIVRKYYNNDLAKGDSNSPIYAVLDMEHASDEGFIESLKTANKVRGIHKHKMAMLADDDIKKQSDAFEARFKDAAENGGIVTLDSMEDFVPINLTNYSANAAQMKETANRIYTYMRTPEEIVQSKYSEHVGQAWYESIIEPLWDAFSQALTNACFTQTEKNFGNRLTVSGGVMMGTSLQTRINIIAQSKEIGILSINEQRELLGYPPVEGGDKRLVSLNYIDSEDQSEYQSGKKDKNDNGDSGGSGTPPTYKEPAEGGEE